MDPACEICQQHEETVAQELWSYPIARNVWELVSGKQQKCSSEVEDFYVLVQELMVVLSTKELEVWAMSVFLYGRLYLILSGLEKELSTEQDLQNKPLKEALASQSFVQIGFLLSLPTMMQTSLESGFRSALIDFILMQLSMTDFILMYIQLAPVFFTFSLATKIHYYGNTLLHGAKPFRGIGRGFELVRVKFSENYMLYSRSHFIKGIELTILLLVYQILGQSHRGAVSHFLIILSIWLMVGTWLFAPFLFNPSGFEW
nr:callose synthase 1-like [Quercus suber]